MCVGRGHQGGDRRQLPQMSSRSLLEKKKKRKRLHHLFLNVNFSALSGPVSGVRNEGSAVTNCFHVRERLSHRTLLERGEASALIKFPCRI